MRRCFLFLTSLQFGDPSWVSAVPCEAKRVGLACTVTRQAVECSALLQSSRLITEDETMLREKLCLTRKRQVTGAVKISRLDVERDRIFNPVSNGPVHTREYGHSVSAWEQHHLRNDHSHGVNTWQQTV